jgi:hypothetical protein
MHNRLIQIKTLLFLIPLNLKEILKGSKIRHSVRPKKDWWNRGMPIKVNK